MDQLLQVAGALLILIAFASVQFGWLHHHSRIYLVFNMIGAAVLTYLAIVLEQWGFVLLESVWTVVAAWGLFQVLRRRRRVAA